MVGPSKLLRASGSYATKGLLFITLIGGGIVVQKWFMSNNIHNYFPDKEPYSSMQPLTYMFPVSQGLLLNFAKSYDPAKFTSESDTKELYLKLLQLAKLDDQATRHGAINALSMLPPLDVSQYRTLAQASDLKLAVGLARTLNAVPEMFLPPPSYRLLEKDLSMQFEKLLDDLQEHPNECAKYLANYAQAYWQFNCSCDVIGDVNDEYKMNYIQRWHPFTVFEKLYLEVLLAYSAVPSCRPLIVKNGVLSILHEINLCHKTDTKVQSLSGKIIANIALDSTLHHHIFESGWIRTLSSWVRSETISVSLPAAKALANLDTDSLDNSKFADGIYLIYPLSREDPTNADVDIIFVHGIMGGAFKTWRQHDSRNKGPEKLLHPNSSKKVLSDVPSDSENNTNVDNLPYTYCWPKDWLSKDFPNSRIIAIDYGSHFSKWNVQCPSDNLGKDLKMLSRNIFEKIIASGIGKRPIIWVSHSMGGLIVKHMLLDALRSDNFNMKSVALSTVGIVFYSVPHKGTDINFKNKAIDFFVRPSDELKQLVKGSPELIKLHEDFTTYVKDKNLYTVSFGETEKSKVGFGWNTVLVKPDSADPGFGNFYAIKTDHLNTCKPVSPESPSYKLLIKCLKTVIPCVDVNADEKLSSPSVRLRKLLGLIK